MKKGAEIETIYLSGQGDDDEQQRRGGKGRRQENQFAIPFNATNCADQKSRSSWSSVGRFPLLFTLRAELQAFNLYFLPPRTRILELLGGGVYSSPGRRRGGGGFKKGPKN